MVRNIYAELYKTADYRDRLDIEKYAIQSESVRRREAFVKAASWIPYLNATTDDLDRNPWLLNVENGAIDHRGEMDVIWNFIRERCVQKPELSIRARELFRVRVFIIKPPCGKQGWQQGTHGASPDCFQSLIHE